MATLKDVAKIAGVDPSTVSRVLNGDKSLTVRPDTYARIWEASLALGYRPNAAARSLRTRVTNTLALLVPDIENPVYAQILFGMQQVASQRNYCTLVMHTSAVGEQSDLRRQYQELLSSGRVDGFIMADAQVNDALISELLQQDLPFVLVNRPHPDVAYCVVGDDVGGARLATEHLLQLGHRRIAHLAGSLDLDPARGRLQGYQQALQLAGMTCEERYAVEAGLDVPAGSAGMRRLLTLQPRPTAVLATNVRVAIGAIRAAYEAGLAVPADISVAALQDIPIAAQYIPSITAVRMPLREMGAKAAEMLLAELAGQKGRGEVVRSPMELIARESTAAVGYA